MTHIPILRQDGRVVILPVQSRATVVHETHGNLRAAVHDQDILERDASACRNSCDALIEHTRFPIQIQEMLPYLSFLPPDEDMCSVAAAETSVPQPWPSPSPFWTFPGNMLDRSRGHF